MKIKIPGSNHFWMALLVVALFAQTMAIVFNWQRIDILWWQNAGSGKQNVMDGTAQFPIKVYIENAVKSLYSNQVVADPAGDKVYLPEAKIYLPQTTFSRNIYYSYEPADASSPAQVSLNTGLNMNRLINSWDNVPCIQRMAGFTIGKGTYWNGGDSAGTKTLKDGRTLYIYKNENKACAKYWVEGYGADALVKLLSEAQSY